MAMYMAQAYKFLSDQNQYSDFDGSYIQGWRKYLFPTKRLIFPQFVFLFTKRPSFLPKTNISSESHRHIITLFPPAMFTLLWYAIDIQYNKRLDHGQPMF